MGSIRLEILRALLLGWYCRVPFSKENGHRAVLLAENILRVNSKIYSGYYGRYIVCK